MMLSLSLSLTFSFRPLIDLLQERLKHLRLQSFLCINLRNPFSYQPYSILFILRIHCRDVQLQKDSLTLRLLSFILPAITLIQHLSLLLICPLQCCIDDPTTLVVHYICAHLAQRFRIRIDIQIIVLALKVLPERYQDPARLLQIPWRRKLQVMQRQGNGQIEAVVRRFVNDNKALFRHGELRQVNHILGRGQQIAQLPDLRLQGDLVEQFQKVDVSGMGAEMFLQKRVDGSFQYKGVIDGDHADRGHFVPARLASAGVRCVHYVIRDQKEGLKEFG